MIKIIVTPVLLLCTCLIVAAQPGKPVKKPVPTDPFCDSLQLILKNSREGFINHRYNETTASASITYNTTLTLPGFDKRYVQTGMVTPYKKTAAVTLPYFISTAVYTDLAAANLFFSTIKRKLVSCLKPVGQDSAAKTGFARYTSFQVSKAVKDSFVTVELIMLTDPKKNTVIFRLFNSKGSLAKGNMKSPPVVVNTNKNHYTQLLPLLQALTDYSTNNFTAIRGTLLQNEKWKPTYTSIVSFRDLVLPKIEYVTNNLWNQYTTSLYIKDEATGKQRFKELAAEIEQCKTAFPSQRYETRSTTDEKWWYYDEPRIDAEGKRYKNSLRLELKTLPYGDGFLLTLEFRKSV